MDTEENKEEEHEFLKIKENERKSKKKYQKTNFILVLNQQK